MGDWLWQGTGGEEKRGLMGNDVEARRLFIQQNAKDVRFLDA